MLTQILLTYILCSEKHSVMTESCISNEPCYMKIKIPSIRSPHATTSYITLAWTAHTTLQITCQMTSAYFSHISPHHFLSPQPWIIYPAESIILLSSKLLQGVRSVDKIADLTILIPGLTSGDSYPQTRFTVTGSSMKPKINVACDNPNKRRKVDLWVIAAITQTTWCAY